MLFFLCSEANYLTLSYAAAGIYFSKQKFYAGTISSASFVIDPQNLFFSYENNENGTPGSMSLSKHCYCSPWQPPYLGISCIMTGDLFSSSLLLLLQEDCNSLLLIILYIIAPLLHHSGFSSINKNTRKTVPLIQMLATLK